MVVSIRRGETIAVDLQNNYGVDRGSDWHNFNVSDESVLGTVVAPSARLQVSATVSPIGRVVYARTAPILVHLALTAGESPITACPVACRGPGGAAPEH